MGTLSKSFFQEEDVVALARQIVGKTLFTKISEEAPVTGGIITEVEAYAGFTDKASHAYRGKTKRNAPMFESGGIAYVYLCYGIHHLLNFVTGPEDLPHAILLRAIEPTVGKEEMIRRRGTSKNLTQGPGSCAKALGITTADSGKSLFGPKIWLEDQKIALQKIVGAKRVGIDYAEEDAKLPWRFIGII